MRRPLRGTVAAALASLVLAGCGGGTVQTTDPAVHAAAASTDTEPTVLATATATGALRATLTNTGKPITIWAMPGGDSTGSLPASTSYRSARTLLVDRIEGDWVRVLLPTRPNGSTGWVKAADIRISRIQESISVNLTAKTITVTLPGQAPVAAPAGIGTVKNPTPKGRFYVTDRVTPANPAGAYGPLALGLSAHSDTLSEFGSGDGQIGIHGTNEPASIGKAASHGCIRVPTTIVTLLRQIPLGTPVLIS